MRSRNYFIIATINKIYLLVITLILFAVNSLFAQDLSNTPVNYAVGTFPASVF